MGNRDERIGLWYCAVFGAALLSVAAFGHLLPYDVCRFTSAPQILPDCKHLFEKPLDQMIPPP